MAWCPATTLVNRASCSPNLSESHVLVRFVDEQSQMNDVPATVRREIVDETLRRDPLFAGDFLRGEEAVDMSDILLEASLRVLRRGEAQRLAHRDDVRDQIGSVAERDDTALNLVDRDGQRLLDGGMVR